MQTKIVHQRPAKSIGLFSKLRPVSHFCVGNYEKCAILPHLRMLRYVQMPTPFGASKLLPVALHFACKVRYVRRVPSSVVRNKFGVHSVRLWKSQSCPDFRPRRTGWNQQVESKHSKHVKCRAMRSKARMILRVSFQNLCLEDVAILNDIAKTQYRRIFVPGLLSLVGAGGCMFGRFQFVVRTVKMHLHNSRHIQPNRF